MKVLVCGDRNWDDSHAIDAVLSGLAFENQSEDELIVINGLAKGADSIAQNWAQVWAGEEPDCFPTVIYADAYPADWETHHRAAGPIRNQQMLVQGKPDVVYAFHDDIGRSKGTRDMVNRAVKAGIPTYVVGRVQEKVPELPPVDKKKIREDLKQIALDVEGI